MRTALLPALSDMAPPDLLKDANYHQLVRRFAVSGRGNRPKPPDLPLTNRLLLQLRKLKIETGKTTAAVEGWFSKLFPGLSFPASRIPHLINRIHTRYLALQNKPEDVAYFLQQQLDLDSVSDGLTGLGLKRGQLLSTTKTVNLPEGFVCTNQLVVDIENFRSRESSLRGHSKFTTDWVSLLCREDVTDASVKTTVEHHRLQNRQRGRNPEQVSAYLQSAFSAKKPQKRVPTAASSHGTLAKKTKSEEEKVLETLHGENFQLRQQQDHQEKQNFILQTVVTELVKDNLRLRAIPVERNLKDAEARAELLSNKLNTYQQKYEHMGRGWNETQRQLDRQRERTIQKDEELTRQREQIEDLTQRLQREQERYLRLLDEHEALQTPTEVQDNQITTRLPSENNRFTNTIRQTLIALHTRANVPAIQCTEAIQCVAVHMFGINIPDKDLPCLQSCINIIDEGTVLANIQATEAILNSRNCTLHTDGTSRNQKKIVGQQVTLDSGMTLSLGFYVVPTEDAATLLEFTRKKLEEMTDLYADATSQEREDIFRSLLHKLTSLMSDRSAVMKKFNADFLNYLRTEIGECTVVHFLYCNAHFLLGLSRACDEGLKTVEANITKDAPRLGRDKFPKYRHFLRSAESATSRNIRTAADVTGPCGDDQNGCRQEWLSHCKDLDIKSRMTSYRSNRFNSYFEGAAAVIHHLELLKRFFPALPHSNMKLESIQDDLQDEKLMALVSAVAIVFS